MDAPASPRLSRLLTSTLLALIVAGCGQGDGPRQITNRPATPLPPIPAGFCDPVNFEILCDPVDIINFNGGATTIIDNPDPSGINTSDLVAQMQKFADEVFGGTRLDLSAAYNFADGEAFTIKVWSPRPVSLLFKLEQQNLEQTFSHSGSGTWEELCFDFSGATSMGIANNSVTLIFDNGVLGQAATDPTNWTFYYDDITQVASCPSGGLPSTFSAIDFDDSTLTYTLTGFAGGEDAAVAADPDDATNQVMRVNRSDSADTFAGTTISLGPNLAIPDIPLDASNTQMNARVRGPGPNIPVRLKIEDAANSAVAVETEALTTATDAWESLTFDFSMQAMGTPAFDPAATYNKITVFFNFGTDGATAGAQTFYIDDIDVGAGSGGGGGGGAGTGIIPDNVVYATDPGVTEDLAPAGLDNFGSGAVFDTMFAGDASFNPAIQVSSGTDFGGDVGFIAFTGYAGGFASTYDNFVFKVNGAAANLAAWEVKFIGPTPAEDVSMVYDLTSFSGVTDIGGGWLQVEVPMTDFAANIAVNNGFLMGPLGDQGAPFSYLLTDIGFTTSGGGGGGGGITPQNVVYATDPGVTEDLAPAGFDNFGSGAVFDTMFAGDATFNPAIQVASGTGFGVDVGFIAFTGYAGGFASTFDNFVFKVNGDAANLTGWEVKFIGPSPAEDVSMVYDLTTFAGATDIGGGWLQVEVPMSDFAANIGVNNGFLVGPLGDQGAPFSYLLTDIGFTTSGGGGGGGGGGGSGGNLATNGDLETGDLTGWTTFDNDGTIAVTNTDASTGTFSLNVISQFDGTTASNPVIKQERIAQGVVQPGQAITVSFDIKGSVGVAGAATAQFFSEGAMVVTENLETFVADVPDWTTRTYNVTTAADVSGGITFQLNAACGAVAGCAINLLIDNLSITID